MLKKDIRKIYAEKRSQLSEKDMRSMTGRILIQLENLSLFQPGIVLSYYPIVERREFRVDLCEKIIQQRFPAATIAWPRLEADGVNMQAIAIHEHTVLQPNAYNIPEPVEGETIDPQTIDIVFVPLLAFDQKGFRTGYGKGYYDRYLVRCRPDVVKLGFSLFEPLEAIEDINEFDVPLNYCITPMRVYEF